MGTIGRFILVVGILLTGCAKEHDYSADDATFNRIRAAKELEQRETERKLVGWSRDLNDKGAETAKAKAAKIFGIEDTAARRVFMFDSSGSLMTGFDGLRRRLKDEIAALDSQTAFSVLFFTYEGYAAVDRQWLMADANGKQRAMDFINALRPYGSTDPVPGIKQAFALKPDVIYLGTDGDFPNNAAVLDAIRNLDPNHQVRINTVLLGDGEPEIQALLQGIASESGGRFARTSLDP